MAMDHLARYEKLMAAANEYHAKGSWQEKLNALQQALVETQAPRFPVDDEYRYTPRFELGTVYRRFGRFERAEHEYQSLLNEFPTASPAFQASVFGELGLLSRHKGTFQEARERFGESSRLARLVVPSSLPADAEVCRVIGNEGMAIYNMWQAMTPQDPAILQEAIAKMNERVDLSQKLQRRARSEDPGSKYLGLGQTWESVGLSRLAVLYVAAGNTGKAVDVARECRKRQTGKDPTVSAFSAFFLGNALWHDGQKDAALEVWNVPPETTSPATALCKEPSEEHNGYLKFMADAGVDFDISDEHGFSALDYAILGGSKDAVEAVPIVEGALRRAIDSRIRSEQQALSEDEIQKRVTEAIAYKKRQAELRRLYRTVLQEQIRPELRAKSGSILKNLRDICSRFVTEDPKGQTMLDRFKYVRYIDFKNHQKLPRSDSGLTKVYSEADTDDHAIDELFVIFFSYRWIGGAVPDDSNNTQWRRMINCVEAFLVQNPNVRPETLGIWLDLACIDQIDDETRRSGIDALPLAVTQCNAMISLVDHTYYTRAWCVVEVMLIRELQRAYKFHVWQEESGGTLQKADKERVVDVSNLGLSREDDRPSVDFLLKQGALLGKDDA